MNTRGALALGFTLLATAALLSALAPAPESAPTAKPGPVERQPQTVLATPAAGPPGDVRADAAGESGAFPAPSPSPAPAAATPAEPVQAMLPSQLRGSAYTVSPSGELHLPQAAGSPEGAGRPLRAVLPAAADATLTVLEDGELRVTRQGTAPMAPAAPVPLQPPPDAQAGDLAWSAARGELRQRSAMTPAQGHASPVPYVLPPGVQAATGTASHDPGPAPAVRH